MHSPLFELLGTSAPSYFALLITGFLFAAIVGVLWAKRIGQNPDVIVDLTLSMLLAGVVGARIMHVLADGYFWDYVHLCTDPSLVDWQLSERACLSERYNGVWDAARQVCHPRKSNCFAWAYFWAGGLTYYGGFIAASITAWFLCKRDKFPFWKVADVAGFAVPLGLTFGRIGCLLAGCCFGIQNSGPLGVVFPGWSPASESQYKAGLLRSMGSESLPVLPAQIAEAAATLAIAAFCMLVVHPRKRYDGHVFVVFVVLYAVARFGLEFLRADDRGGMLALSTSQWVGIALIAAAILIHVSRVKKLVN